MKALLIHRFYYPDSPPYAVILRNMSEVFQRMGFSVDVLSSKPSYKSQDYNKVEQYHTIESDKLKIFRIPVLKTTIIKLNKVINYFWFPVAVFFWMLFGRSYNVVTVSTSPPVILPFFVALVCRIRGFKLVYHCMDIHPEIGKLSGEFKNKYIYKFLLWMDNFTCKSACKVIVLSQDMKASISKRGMDLGDKVEIMNNYELPSDVNAKEELAPTFMKAKGTHRVVFTGNIGRYQNLYTFVQALLENETIDNFELVFVGEGVVLKQLKLMAKPLGDIVKFIPHQPVQVAKAIIRDSDMAIVSLAEKVVDYAYPSKTMTYLSQGTPILLSVEENSEIAKFVLDNKVGIKVRPSNLKDIYEAYKEICAGSKLFNRERVRKIYKKEFSIQVFNAKLENLLNELKK